MYHCVSKTDAIITPETAQEFLMLNTFAGQRSLRPEWANVLGIKMTDGRFLEGDIVTCSNGKGKRYLMNGQHQCEGSVMHGVSFSARVRHFECPTPADESELFRQFDTTPRRTLAEMTRVEAPRLGLSWPSRTYQLVLGGIILNTKGQTRGRQAWEKVELLQYHIPEGEFVNSIFCGKELKEHAHLRRRAVAAIMMRTWKKAHDDAERFWSHVRDREMLAKNDPEFKLAEFLLTNGSNIGPANGFPRNRLIKDHEFMYRSAGAWNAFRRGEKISHIKYYWDRPVPQCI